jgi:hypothetical protein
LTDQITALSYDPLTVATNCFDWPAVREGFRGLSETVMEEVDGGPPFPPVPGGYGPPLPGGGGNGPPDEVGEVPCPSIIDALAVLVESARLVAVTVTRDSWPTELGAT